MTRLWTIWLALVLTVLATAPVMAQTTQAQTTTTPPAPTQPAVVATTAGQPAPPTPQQAAQALAILTDDARRTEMIAVLQTIARTAPAATPAPSATAHPQLSSTTPAPTTPAPTTPAPATPAVGAAAAAPAKLAIPLAPDSLGAEVLVGVSDRLETLSQDVGNAVRSLANFTLLERWATSVAADPDSRAEVLDATWKLTVVAVVSLAIERAVSRLLGRPRRALLRIAPPPDPSDSPDPPDPAESPQPAEAARPQGATPESAKPERARPQGVSVPPAAAHHRQRRRARAMATLRRVPLVLCRLLLELVPVLVMGAAGYGLLGSRLGEPSTSKLVILALLNAYLLCRVVVVTTRVLVSPDAPGLRLIPLDPHAGARVVRWMGRIAVVALFGYALTEVALLFGLYRVAHDALIKLVALAVHLMLAFIVWQNRVPVARLIHTPPGRTGFVAILRNRLAAIWHIVVIFYIVALWVVWALDVPGGFSKLLWVFVSTFVIGTLARFLVVLLSAWLDHAMTLDTAAAGRAPGLDSAMRRYQPVVRTALELLIAGVAFVALMQIWGLDSLSWFRSDALGGRLLSAVLTSAVTIAIGLLIWEASNAAVQNHLARMTREGHPARSARLRTLLPMLRTTLLVAITLFAGLTVLSQIGVNIAPLLAGAGVVGLAIGFGSQKLVQDIITGLFLLLENTMQVGDVVTLGGLTGTVENLSIRTIRLRAIDGAVHIVPFSAVTTVTNLTRDFAYAMLDVSVGLNEEPDLICTVIEDVAEAMRRESRWGAAITDRMEIMGVERFIDTAWVLRCRIKTVPSQRWAVARELNRRLKYAFDAKAIESPFTSYKALSAATAVASEPLQAPSQADAKAGQAAA